MPTESTTELQATLDDIRQRKAARRLLTGPQNKAPDPATIPSIEARIAKLQGITAGAKDDLARIAAKAASKPAPAKPTAPTAVPGLSPRDQRRAAAKGTIADQSDAQLQFIASHRSATDADRSAARTELESRGWTIHPSGSFSQSIRKAPRR
jgi:hypothetical protein